MPVMVVLLSVLVFLTLLLKAQLKKFVLDADRYNYWVSQGAQPSERVAQIAKTALLLNSRRISMATIPPSDQLITIGRVQSAYGIKGWVWVYSNTEPTTNIFAYMPLGICSR
jgi:hypothetical protein